MTKTHKQTIREHVEAHYRCFQDMSNSHEEWYSIDGFAQNVQDSCIEDGYSGEEAFDAKNWFYRVAERDNGSVD